jgi:threonyl-tRNA synthetase
LVVGDAERGAGTVAVRPYQGDQRKDVPLATFVDELTTEIAERGARRTT